MSAPPPRRDEHVPGLVEDRRFVEGAWELGLPLSFCQKASATDPCQPVSVNPFLKRALFQVFYFASSGELWQVLCKAGPGRFIGSARFNQILVI